MHEQKQCWHVAQEEAVGPRVVGGFGQAALSSYNEARVRGSLQGRCESLEDWVLEELPH